MSRGAVHCDHVWKRFALGAAHASLADLVKSWLAWPTGNGAGEHPDSGDTFWALRDLNFTLHPGEALGVIGPNGAGKSTLLKLLAGILRADRGSFAIEGRLASLIEVGAGFHGDLTGRENIYLNGAILGMSRSEVRAHFDDIVSFAGLARFIDTPVKRYSSGMYARLGFAIAAHVNPDVLLVDEVLSVGDAAFRLRCESRMQALVSQGTSLVFVTHNLEQMQRVCPRAIVLDRGSVSFDGDSREAVQHYMSAMSEAFTARPSDLASDADDETIEVTSVCFRDASGTAVETAQAGAYLGVEVELSSRIGGRRLLVEVAARAAAGDNIACFNSGRVDTAFAARAGRNRFSLSIPSFPVASGRYFWNVRVWDQESGVTLVDTPFRYPLIVDDAGLTTGVLSLPHTWARMEDGDCPAVAGNTKSRPEGEVVRTFGDTDESASGFGEVRSCESA